MSEQEELFWSSAAAPAAAAPKPLIKLNWFQIMKDRNNKLKMSRNLKPKPQPKPLLAMTNANHFCYDCEKLLTPDCQKGTGFGLLGINLYFCVKCYLTRFRDNEGIIINFSEGYSSQMIDHYRNEFNFYLNFNCTDNDQDYYCFNCNQSNNSTSLYCVQGIINSELTVCQNCYSNFEEVTQHTQKDDFIFIKDEIKYHRKIMNLRIKETYRLK